MRDDFKVVLTALPRRTLAGHYGRLGAVLFSHFGSTGPSHHACAKPDQRRWLDSVMWSCSLSLQRRLISSCAASGSSNQSPLPAQRTSVTAYSQNRNYTPSFSSRSSRARGSAASSPWCLVIFGHIRGRVAAGGEGEQRARPTSETIREVQF